MESDSKILDLYKKLKEMESKISPGPWEVFGKDEHVLGNTFDSALSLNTKHHQWTHNTTKENALFICEIRNNISTLLIALEKLNHDQTNSK